MWLEILRSIVRLLTRILTSRFSTSLTPFSSAFTPPKPGFHLPSAGSVGIEAPWFPIANHFPSLTDTRFPKRRPRDKPHRKRALKVYDVWVQYTSGGPILPNQPHEGSVKRRNEKKCIRLLRAFILAKLQEGGT